MIHLCTYFDRHYLVRGLALFRSLRRHAEPFTLWVLCFDAATFDALTALGEPSIRPIRLEDLERDDPALAAVKGDRSTVEYYFTSTPCLPLHVLRVAPEIEAISYVDADLLFYSDPRSILDELGVGSVAIIAHRFPDDLRSHERYGIFNVGMLAFRNDERGKACLERWRAQCLEWCYDRVEVDRFADQGYLNDWPARLEGVVVIENPGAGLGPWNVMRYDIGWEASPPTVDGRPLVFYHFQGFKQLRRGLFDLGVADYGGIPRSLRRRLYGRYVRELDEAARWLRSRVPDAPIGSATRRTTRPSVARMAWGLVRGRLMLSAGPVRR